MKHKPSPSKKSRTARFLRHHWLDLSAAVLILGAAAWSLVPNLLIGPLNAQIAWARELPERLELPTESVTAHVLETNPTFPQAEDREPRISLVVPITAYSSEPWQTDDTPFITASGTHVRDGVIAANFLPIGAQVRIPELYGDKMFVVEDRMNPRYDKRIDIWMADTPSARQFGIKYAKIEVF